MKRKIIGFDRDDEQDWRAKLECGHYQHVCHDPPLITREWTLTVSGRDEKIGPDSNAKNAKLLSPEISKLVGAFV